MAKILGLTIPLYGIYFFLGIILATFVGIFLLKRKKLESFNFICASIYAMIGAILGAKLLFILVSWEKIIRLGLSFEEIIKDLQIKVK